MYNYKEAYLAMEKVQNENDIFSKEGLSESETLYKSRLIDLVIDWGTALNEYNEDDELDESVLDKLNKHLEV